MCRYLLALFFISASAGALAQLEADLRDPTTPLDYTVDVRGAGGETEWVLDSVLISNKRRLAIINGETLREGQLLPGSNEIKIQRILPQTVMLRQGEKTWALKMSPSVRH